MSRMENGWGRANMYFPSIIVTGFASQKTACASKETVTERAKNCCLGRKGVAFISHTQGTWCQPCCNSSESEYVTAAKCMGVPLVPSRSHFHQIRMCHSALFNMWAVRGVCA